MSTMKRIDWNAVADRCARMTDKELIYALSDIQKTLPAARALDRAFGTDDEGYYCDEASVIRRERERRPGFNAERRRVEDPPQASEDGVRDDIRCPSGMCSGTVKKLGGRLGRKGALRCESCWVWFHRSPSGILTIV